MSWTNDAGRRRLLCTTMCCIALIFQPFDAISTVSFKEEIFHAIEMEYQNSFPDRNTIFLWC